MDQQYAEFVGVDSVCAAIITEDSESAYTTEAPEYFAPTADIAGEPEIDSASRYYDNVPGFTYVTEGVTKLAITFSGVPADKASKYLGKYFNEADGRVYDTGQPDPPDVALSFRMNRGKSGYRYYQYLKGTFSGGKEEAASKTEKIETKTYQMTFTAIVTTHQWEIDGEMKGLKRIFADTTSLAFEPAGWFTQVQTPDTVGAPAAIALSSIVPADGATGVEAGAAVVLTFNNKIVSNAVTLIDTTTGNVVAAAKTWNAAGTVLTLTPTSALSAATKYIVSVAGVVDVYGQELAAVGNDFTTA